MKQRRGFSLVEVIVSLVLLMAGILAVQTAVVRMAHQITSDSRVLTAVQLAGDRLEQVRADPQYVNLKATYHNSPTGEVDVGGNKGLTRVTVVSPYRDSTKDASGVHITDYTRVTVTVSGTGLTTPIARTVTVGSP